MNEESNLSLRTMPFLVPKLETEGQEEIEDIMTGDDDNDDVTQPESRPRRSEETGHFTGLLPLDIKRKRGEYKRRSKVMKRYRLGLYDCISSYCGETEGEKRLSCISFYCHRDWTFLFFFQNEEIFVKLDELNELDWITHAWIGFNFSLTQAKKTF